MTTSSIGTISPLLLCVFWLFFASATEDLPVIYGKSSVALAKNNQKTHNSKGEMVPIEEVDYRADVEPTHLIVQISAGCMPPFTGCPGNIVWCDNIRLEYDNAK